MQVPFNRDDLKHTELINWLNRIHEVSHKENEQATEIDVETTIVVLNFIQTQHISYRAEGSYSTFN